MTHVKKEQEAMHILSLDCKEKRLECPVDREAVAETSFLIWPRGCCSAGFQPNTNFVLDRVEYSRLIWIH